MSSYQKNGGATSSAPSSEEHVPLMMNVTTSGSATTGNNGNAVSRKRPIIIKAAAIALFATALVVLGMAWNGSRSRRSETNVPSMDEPLVTPPAILYRPLCEYYQTSTTTTTTTASSTTTVLPPLAVGIQTSMKSPSQQWADIACFPVKQQAQSTSSPRFGQRLFHRGDNDEENNNDDYSSSTFSVYGAPDAILQVNFSQLAFDENRPPILGFGGAFTEAAALNFHTLSDAGKGAAMELLFGKSGLGYTLGRVPINSCDFTLQSYSFDETDGDFDLKDFDNGVTHDVKSGMVDMAQRATTLVREAWTRPPEDDIEEEEEEQEDDTSANTTNATAQTKDTTRKDGELLLYASPWSPPSWMKQPTWEDIPGAVHAAKMTFSTEPTCLRDGVGPKSRYAKAWALYFSKFISAYKNLGLHFWAITIQNEPEFPAPWEACAYTPTTEREFLAYHLGPQLRQDHPDVSILVFDHNKDHVNTWFTQLNSKNMTFLNITNDKAISRPYVDGTAYHWYAGGMDRLLDGALGIPNLHRLQANLDKYGVKKDHIVLGSESCHCPTTGYAGGDIQIYWARAERYAHTILADLAAGSNGWVEWNLILDGIGGPNHLGNLCEATILAVPHRAKDAPDDMPPLPDFEKNGKKYPDRIGDGRTREELNALGFPAKFLDLGIAVQPIYYYMGHISRYVRPGSVAVMALVTSSRSRTGGGKIFMPEGQVVAGGGQNDLARNGIELTVWPCEGSTRQQFFWNLDSKKYILVRGHDWLGVPTTSCVGRNVDRDLLGMRLTNCKKNMAGAFDVVPVVDDSAGRFMIKLTNPPTRRSGDKPLKCLVIRELKNQGGAYGPRGGAQVALGDCGLESAKWSLNPDTGEVSSSYFAWKDGGGSDDDQNANDKKVCMTTGWPFLQMGAFLTPASDGGRHKVVVVLNEANDPANFVLQDENSRVLATSIPPHSIQTYQLD